MADVLRCESCGHQNPAGNRFCGACGVALARACPSCSHSNPPDHRFCGACGTPLTTPMRVAVETRKIVTVVFADLIGSTSLHERLDAESTRRFMDRYYRALRSAVETHGGTVVKLLGDGVLAAFGVPRVAEDDAIRAVRAAVAMRDAFLELVNGPSAAIGAIGLRVGVNTGEVVAGTADDDVVGDPVNVAARLQQEARDGEILLGESTCRLVEGLVTLASIGSLALRGRAETVAAYRVVSLEPPASAAATAFVGREDELRRIQAVYDAARVGPEARLVTILGSPGLGKSRLLEEFARRLGDRAAVLTARCDATGGSTFSPLVDALREHLGTDAHAGAEELRAAVEAAIPGDEPERARIAIGIAALFGGEPAAPEETFYVVRRLLAAQAAKRPLVLTIDDLQWAEPLLLDLAEHLVQWSADVPLVLLVAARPELREARPSLATRGGLVSEVITLAGLDARAATRLAANVIGAEELPAALAGRVLSTSEGNPLFVGELVRMLVHDGALKREGDRWITGVELASLEMPPTIHALLAARIERLRPEERLVLERAAIVGRHFSRAAVAHLLPEGIADLDARLEALRQSDLVEPDSGWFLGEPMLRFHHALIRDAAYRSVLKGTRAELHARFADWIESRAGAVAVEQDEIIGWHLEQAYQNLRELGPVEEHGEGLGARAARHLGGAGRRALGRDDLPVAASLLGRAVHLLDEADPARAELSLDWCEALLASGEVAAAAAAIEDLGRVCEGNRSEAAVRRLVGEEADGGRRKADGDRTEADSRPRVRGRLRAWHTCFAGQHAVLTDPQALRATADSVAAAAEVLAREGDVAGEAKAHSVHALALARLGSIGACEAALDRALAAARRARDRRRSNAVLAGAPPAALWGPSPVTRASGRCLDVVRVLRITQGAPAVEAVALRCQAVLEALRGRTDAARRMIASSRRMVEELGITQRLLEADMFAGLIELLEGDAVAAERDLRRAYEGMRRHGLGIDAALAAALLGRALLALGRDADAEAASRDSEALAGDDLKAAIAWRGVRAEALARRGEHAIAVDFARAAVDIAVQTDALLDHADARLALAAALRAAGRSEEADAEEARAIELWEAKGATLLAERSRASRTHLAAAPTSAPRDASPASRPDAGRRRVRRNAATVAGARMDALVAARNEEAVARFDELAPEAEEGRAGSTAPDPRREDLTREFTRAFAARDWDALSALLAPDLVANDHRLLGWETLHGRRAYIEALRQLVELAPDVQLRVEHLAMSGACFLYLTTWSGTREGGAFETPSVMICELDEEDRIRQFDQYDMDRLAELRRDVEAGRRARRGGLPIPPNAAVLAGERFRARAVARNWESLRDLHAPSYRFEDRRRLFRTSGDRDMVVANARVIPRSVWSRASRTLLATAGDRLALHANHWRGDGDLEFEIETLEILEIDAGGRVVTSILFDPDDRRAASLEMLERYFLGEGARWTPALAMEMIRALNDHDLERMRAALPADFVFHDHRRTGVGRIGTADDYLASIGAVLEQSPDVTTDTLYHVAVAEHGSLSVGRMFGTLDGGGEFEIVFARLNLYRDGRVVATELYEVEDLERARGRFEELRPAPPPEAAAAPSPIEIPQNAASRMGERVGEAIARGDWECLRTLVSADFAFEDRRRYARVVGDIEMWIENLSVVRSWPLTRRSLALVGTAGERVALERVSFAGAGENGAFEGEFLRLTEVGAGERLRAVIHFDADDRAAASLEAQVRFTTGEAAGAPAQAVITRFGTAIDGHAWGAVRACLAEDLVLHDRRPLSFGPISRDEWIESMQVLAELAPDASGEGIRILAWNEHGRVSVIRQFGTRRDGGPFETVFAPVIVVVGDRVHRFEMFDVADADLALARFAELCAEERPRR